MNMTFGSAIPDWKHCLKGWLHRAISFALATQPCIGYVEHKQAWH
jgi:hypothetical protein